MLNVFAVRSRISHLIFPAIQSSKGSSWIFSAVCLLVLSACNNPITSMVPRIISINTETPVVNPVLTSATHQLTTVSFNPAAETINLIPTTITASFSQAIKVSTLTAVHFSVSCTESGAYTVSSVTPASNQLSAVIVLSESVAPVTGEACTLHLSNSIVDTWGNTLTGTTSVTYTLDAVAPTVSYSPASGIVTSMPTSITASFSKAMLGSSVTNVSNWSMGSCTDAGVYSISSVTYNSTTHVATLNLDQNIAPVDGSVCTLTPTTSAIFDTSGNSLTLNSDALTVDSGSPSVVSFSPSSASKNAVPSSVTVTLSKAMNSTTVTNSSNWLVSCNESGAFTVSSVTYNSGTYVATVNLSQSVAPANGEVCTLTPNTSAIEDNGGEELTGSPSVSYTLDTTAPTVVFTPATSVMSSIPSSFSALFSKAMDPSSTGNTSNWSVSCASSGAYTIASVSLSTTTHTNDTATVTLSQTSGATNGAICTLTASTSILDSSGNALTGSRTSAITLDTTTPSISAFSPATSTRNNIPTSVSVTFNDSNMNPTLVQNTSNWTMSCTVGGSYTVSSVSLSGTVATVNLTQNTLASSGAVCTLTASTNIQNLVGASLSGTLNVAYTMACITGSQTFSSAGSTAFNLSTYCTTFTVQIWGAGGGGGGGNYCGPGGTGGGGGYATASFSGATSSSNFTVLVGGSGGGGTSSSGGGGGGRSALQFGGNDILTAAGGGGGGGGSGYGCNSGYGGAGGAGGATTGVGGSNGYYYGGGGSGNSSAGGGGTQSSGGGGGAGFNGSLNGASGSFLSGGAGGASSAGGGSGGGANGGSGQGYGSNSAGGGGGGGGGYYGGGGGGWSFTGSGGGGGSSYIGGGGGFTVSSPSTTAGSGATPGSTGSGWTGNAGTGGPGQAQGNAAGSNGYNGLVIISYP